MPGLPQNKLLWCAAKPALDTRRTRTPPQPYEVWPSQQRSPNRKNLETINRSPLSPPAAFVFVPLYSRFYQLYLSLVRLKISYVTRFDPTIIEMPDPVVDNNGTAAAKSRNPFVDASQPRQKQELELLHVAQKGTQLVTGITKYFSTLPHPIEIVEELVAVVAVTSSLLTALDHALSRFPHLALSRSKSFIAPLCHDVLFAFMLLGSKVDEAKRMKIFEPNDVGLVRLPKSAWVLVVGSEPKVAALRSRLYIEKYRVRVLIETVCFVGLKKLSFRRQKEEEELRALKAMMPLIAERLVGVQTDYVPRLTGRKALPEPAVQVQATIPVPVVEKKSELPVMEIKEKPTLIEEQHFSCRVVASGKESVFSASTDSLTSTCSSSSR